MRHRGRPSPAPPACCLSHACLPSRVPAFHLQPSPMPCFIFLGRFSFLPPVRPCNTLLAQICLTVCGSNRTFILLSTFMHPLLPFFPRCTRLAVGERQPRSAQDISPAASLVETELFPRGALEYYTAKNMGWEFSQQQCDEWQVKPSRSFLSSPFSSCWAADTFLRVFRRQSGQQV